MAKKTYTELVSSLGRNAESDECYTPADQVLPLLQYLDKDKTYYEATSGKSSNILTGFNKYGYNIVGSNNRDFFKIYVRPNSSGKAWFSRRCS